MRLPSLLLSLLAPVLVASQAGSSSVDDQPTDNTLISIQPVTLSPPAPAPLAKIAYNPSTLTSNILDYYAPELSPSSSSSTLFRVGIYSPKTSTWKTSTTVTSSSSFEKGYSPTFVVTLDDKGEVLGVKVSSSRIDAGQTRDFGPKVLVRAPVRGKGPVLNRPVVVDTTTGKVEAPPVEKTLLQKYWWVGLAAVLLLAGSGGE